MDFVEKCLSKEAMNAGENMLLQKTHFLHGHAILTADEQRLFFVSQGMGHGGKLFSKNRLPVLPQAAEFLLNVLFVPLIKKRRKGNWLMCYMGRSLFPVLSGLGASLAACGVWFFRNRLLCREAHNGPPLTFVMELDTCARVVLAALRKQCCRAERRCSFLQNTVSVKRQEQSRTELLTEQGYKSALEGQTYSH